MNYDIRIKVNNGNLDIEMFDNGNYYTEDDIDGLNIKFTKDYLGEGKLDIVVSIPKEDVNKT